MALFFILYSIVICVWARTVDIYASQATPFSLVDVVGAARAGGSQDGDIHIHIVSNSKAIEVSDGSFVADYTYDEEISVKLEREIGEREYRAMWGRGERVGDGEGQEYEKEFSEVLKTLGFAGVGIIANTETRNVRVGQRLLATDPSLYRDVSIIPESADLHFCIEYVGRMIKPRGINLLAIFADEHTALNLLEALEAKKLNRVGYAFVLSRQAAGYRYLSNPKTGLLSSGVLFVGEKCATADSRIDFEVCRLSNLLRQLEGSGDRSLTPSWSLFALNNSRAQIVDLPSHTNLLFPGNSVAVPSLSKAKIRASVNYEMMNPDGSLYPLGKQWMRGFQVAFQEVNNCTDLIPDYFLEDRSVSFAALGFSYNVSKQRVIAEKPNLGLIYMCVPSTLSIIGMTKVFKDLNLTMPITAGSIGSVLSDPKTYPRYLRPRVANAFMFSIISRLISFFGWKTVAVLYAGDSGDNEEGYKRFLESAKLFNINITNPESTRKLPTVLNNATAAAVNQSLEFIVNSDTRILLMLHGYNYVIMEQMYDLGVREEFVLLVVTGLSDGYYSDPAFYKRRVVSKGALMFFPKVFVGAVGQRVWNELTAIDGKGVFPNTCFFYDAAYLYFHATDFLLEKGLDYEDPILIIKTMRETYFQGCSGFFKIESGMNDRVASEIAVTNFQYNSENDTYELKVVGGYNPYSTQPYQFPSKIQWPDDGKTYADVKPTYKNCPFLEEVVRNVKDGQVIAMVVSFVAAFLSLIASILIWRKWWRVPLKVLKDKQPISVEDVLALSTIACDFFQFAAVGPELSYISHFVASISSGFGFNMENFINITNGVYWVVLDVVLALVAIWTIICILKFTETDSIIGKMCSSFVYWTELLMPTLGNLMFLPIVSTLTNVFICYKGISDELTDSFLDKDCYEFCWRDEHLGYAIGSGIALMFYIPLAIFTRPLWQELQTNVHVKARPLALMIKSVVQIFLIVSSNTLKQNSPSTHAGIFFSIVSLYILFMLRVRQFNYDRLNLWQILVMFAMLILAIAGYVANTTSDNHSTELLIALFIVFIVLAGIGMVLQTFVHRFASKLERAKSRDVRGLFEFAFTTGQRAKAGLEQFYTANSISISRIRKESELSNL